METKVNYTVLGLFVIALVTAITLSIIWLSSGFSFGDYRTYEIFMQEAVSGLNVDSVVEFNGVNVGAVKRILISQKHPNLVELLISVKRTTPITQGTSASLESRGLTGITYIALQDTGTNLKPLTLLPNHRYPIIKTTPSLFMQVDKALGKLNEHVEKVSAAVLSILDQQNQLAFKQILQNINQVTANLAGDSQKINQILDNTLTATQKFPALIQSGQSAVQALQTRTLPAANRAFENLNVITRNLTKTSDEIKRNPAVLIRGRATPLPGPGER